MRVSRFILTIFTLAILANSAPIDKRASETEYLILVLFIALVGIEGFASFSGALSSCNGDGGCTSNAVDALCGGDGQCQSAAWNLIASGG
jgi:hypothetical protein